MKVGLFRSSDTACDYYRTRYPMQAAERSKALIHKEIWMSNLMYEISENPDKFEDIASSDIYLLQRVSGGKFVDRMKKFISDCKLTSKIVMDYDDDIFSVSPMSNHYVDYGTEEIKIIHNGKLLHEWKDGVNIDLRKNANNIEESIKAIRKVDLVTVTTDRLADVYRPYNQNIKVLPNCVDLRKWNKLSIARKNTQEIRVGWSGGHSHWEDLLMIRKPLMDIAEKYPFVKVIMIGWKPLSMEKYFKMGQFEFHDWEETPAHPYRIASLDLDFAFIPLKDTPFNRAKSPIKWIEFGALKIPSISSYIKPYSDMAGSSSIDNGIYVEGNDLSGWMDAFEFMINKEDARREMGEQAREVVEAHFDINTQYQQWVDAYKEVLCPLTPTHC